MNLTIHHSAFSEGIQRDNDDGKGERVIAYPLIRGRCVCVYIGVCVRELGCFGGKFRKTLLGVAGFFPEKRGVNT